MSKVNELLDLMETKLVKKDMKIGMRLKHRMRGECRVHRMETSNPDTTSVYVTFKGDVDVEEVSIALMSRIK